MPKGPNFNYLEVNKDLRISPSYYSGAITFGDGEICISSSADGSMGIHADTGFKVTATTSELEGTTITLDGNTTIDTGHTLTAPTLSGTTASITTLNVLGDLTRNYGRYISGIAAAAVPAGYTRCTDALEIIDEGVAILSGKSGSIYPKLNSSPSIGKLLTLIYINSGASTNNTAVVSSCGYRTGDRGIRYLATFTYPGDALTLTNDGTYWLPVGPSGGKYSIFS